MRQPIPNPPSPEAIKAAIQGIKRAEQRLSSLPGAWREAALPTDEGLRQTVLTWSAARVLLTESPLRVPQWAEYSKRVCSVRGMRGKQSVMSVIGATRQVVRALFPAFTRKQHAEHAFSHAVELKGLRLAYSDALNMAALVTWERPYEATDYRISGIASDEFPEVYKQRLRDLARAIGIARTAEHAHAVAAGVVALRAIGYAEVSSDES